MLEIIASKNDAINIKIVSSPYFLATKLEAFKTRGKLDFMASHDFEDIISVLDGRGKIIQDIEQSDSEVKKYLQDTFREFFYSRAFLDSLPGHFFPYGELAYERIALLKANMVTITLLND